MWHTSQVLQIAPKDGGINRRLYDVVTCLEKSRAGDRERPPTALRGSHVSSASLTSIEKSLTPHQQYHESCRWCRLYH